MIEMDSRRAKWLFLRIPIRSRQPFQAEMPRMMIRNLGSASARILEHCHKPLWPIAVDQFKRGRPAGREDIKDLKQSETIHGGKTTCDVKLSRKEDEKVEERRELIFGKRTS